MSLNNKPSDMSVREFLTKKLSQDINVSQMVIEKVMSHHYEYLVDQLRKKNHTVVEIFNFGNFTYARKRAQFHLKKMLQRKEILEETLKHKELSDSERHKAEERLLRISGEIKYLQDVKKIVPKD